MFHYRFANKTQISRHNMITRDGEQEILTKCHMYTLRYTCLTSLCILMGHLYSSGMSLLG